MGSNGTLAADASAKPAPSDTRPVDRVADDRSRPCEREPLHVPGAIQSHGALLAVLETSRTVTHASANLHDVLGRSAADVLGRPLDTVIGEAAVAALLQPRPHDTCFERVHLVCGPTGADLYLHAHRTGPYLCIDIEPAGDEADRAHPTIRAQALMESLRQAGDGAALCELAVRGLKEITGYDRVMACRFGEDGHGEVIAEAAEPGLVPSLGLREPAWDVPVHPRHESVRPRVVAIADASARPVALLVDPALGRGAPIDLAHSGLRSVSPKQRESMRDLQTAARLTIDLAQEGKLWGVLVCHHGRPRVAGPGLRAAVGLVGEVVSLLLANREAAALRAQRASRKAILAELADRLSSDGPLPDAFAVAEHALLGLVDACGAIVEIGGARICVGRTPPSPVAEIALAGLRIISANQLFAIDDTALHFPELDACRADGSGALFLPLESGVNDAILWFRPERSQIGARGDDPTRHVTANPVVRRTRTSSAASRPVVGGRSVPWSQADRAMALEIRDTIRAEVARRTRAALRESEERFQLLAEHSGVVVTLNDMNHVRRYVSPAAEQLLGWRPSELVGRNPIDFIHPDDVPMIVATRAALLTGAVQPACYRFRRPDGSWVWVEGHGRLRNVDETGAPTEYVVVLRDATERKAVEARLTEALGRLERVASIDGLTGIANRRRFDEVADREWHRCGRERLPLSLLLLDADRFKRFNDCYGHLAGDACLQAIAGQLESMAQRPGDLAARYGGEEFLLLLPSTGGDGAGRVAERVRALVEALGIPHAANGDGAGIVTVSIGVATAWPRDGDTASDGLEALFARTDAALYRAKSDGRNRVVVSLPDHGGPVAAVVRPLPGDDGHDPAAVAPGPAQAGDIAATHEALVQFLYRAPIGLVQTSLDGTIEMINPMAASLLMPISQDGDLDDLFVVLDEAVPDLRERVEHFDDASGAVCDGVRIPLPPGATLASATRILSISLSKLDETRLMAMVGDVTLEVQREQSGLARKLDAAARTDSLTQMPNRTVVCDLIERAIAQRRADPSRDFAVLFMNCDRFKQINDTLGYAAGDAVLRLMADRLRATLRPVNRGVARVDDVTMVGRLGGDEFAVLLDLREPVELHTVAERLLYVLSQPYQVETRQFHFGVSMGVVLGAQAIADAPTVLQDSSIAMVEAKRAGGARYVLFEPAMHERALHRGGIESDLRRALLEHQLFVVYQPVVALQADAAGVDDGAALPARSAGVEALVRWRHPTRGVVPPTEFIGVAEQSGLIGPLGEFVLATACRQFVEWQAALGALAPRLLAVNLSRGQLVESGFVEFVAQLLRTTGMPPRQLQLEVTESLAAQDESIQARLHELKALGLTLALDDFGTGYSSLASLHELPVDTVKIDRSFVSEAATSTYHRVLIEATIRVADSLHMATVAEGIETDEQALLLRELRCGKGQGFLFSKPLTALDLVDWLRRPRAA